MGKRDKHLAEKEITTARAESQITMPETAEAEAAATKTATETSTKTATATKTDKKSPDQKELGRLERFVDFVGRVIQYVTYDIWFKKEHEYKSTKIVWWVTQFKVILFTARGIGKHSTFVQSAALTFYTLMSVVPIAALVFAIAKGFGIDSKLIDDVYTEFPKYARIIQEVLGFANNLLERTKGGFIALFGVVMLFWSVLNVFSNVENAFNSIWEVRKPRSLTRKFTDYLAVIVVAPILIVLSSSAGLYFRSFLSDFAPSIIITALFAAAALVLIWTLFTFIYMIMPNTKVKIKNAMIAGIVAGTAFIAFEEIYFAIQSSLSNINIIYGTFAAIPLFLIWLQISWQIVLFGAELSFAYQNINKFQYEKRSEEMSYEYRKKVIVLVMHQISNHFLNQKGAVSSEEISAELNLPLRVVRDVIFNLIKSKLIISTASDDDKTHFYVPAIDVRQLRIFDIIKQVEEVGKDHFGIEQNPKMRAVGKVIDCAESKIINSQENVPVIDLEIP